MAPDMEPEYIRELPSFEDLHHSEAEKAVSGGGDIDLTMPEAWLNQYSLSPMFYTTKAYVIFTVVLSSIVAWGVACWGYQIYTGMGVTHLRPPVFWGLYIATFVFWVGLSHSGTIVSSLLRLTKANWRRPILRGAEAMTAFSLMVAGMFPLIHVGRIWRIYYMFPLPNQRQLWPNFRSPLAWDMLAISVYLTASMIFLYVGLLPDIALARDLCPKKFWKKKYLTVLALGWRGTHRQWHVYEIVSVFLAVFVLLIAPSVHTIVSWDFAMSITPGWHTTIFGPYFVVGAIYSGVAGVITLMVILRWVFDLKGIIRIPHLSNLAKLELVMAVIWAYFYFTEFITAWYAKNPVEFRIWQYQWERFPHLLIIMLGGTAFAIAALSWDKVRTSPRWLLVVTIIINIGMYIERYLIVIPPLSHRDNPFTWTQYTPSFVEASVALGALAYFLLLYAIFAKLLPIVTVADIREGKFVTGSLRIGNAVVRVRADVESYRYKGSEEGEVAPYPLAATASIAKEKTVLGLFENIEDAARMVKPLEGLSVPHSDIKLLSVAPYPEGTLFEDHTPTPVWKVALVGGIIGLVAGVGLGGGTQWLVNLDVGGKPPFSIPPTAVICYEFALLGAVLGTFGSLLWMAELPDWNDLAYDPSISACKIGILARCADEGTAKRIETAMREHGVGKTRFGTGDF